MYGVLDIMESYPFDCQAVVPASHIPIQERDVVTSVCINALLKKLDVIV